MNKLVKVPSITYTWDEIGMTRDEYLTLDDKSRRKLIDKLQVWLVMDVFGVEIPPLKKPLDEVVND